MITLDQVLSGRNVLRAIQQVVSNKGAPGIDGMTVDQYEAHHRRHWRSIAEHIRAGSYIPAPVRRVDIPKPNGGTRMLGIPTVQDRVIQQAIAQILVEAYDPHFSHSSYGYTALELSAAWRYRDTGRIYARYERGYTVPDGLMIADQAVVNGDRVYKITNAEDEKYDMYEIGLRDKVAFSTVSVSLWMSNTNNQLYRMYVRGLSDARTLNLLQTRRWGADVSLQQTIGRLTLTESYSWLKGRSDYTSAGSRFMDEVGKDKIDFTRSGLQKVPQHSLSVLAKYDFTDNFSGDVRYTYYGKYNNFLSDAEKETDGIVKSRQIVDTSLHFKPWEHLEIYAGVTNLFNEKYYDYVSIGSWSLIPGRERTYFVGLRGTY